MGSLRRRIERLESPPPSATEGEAAARRRRLDEALNRKGEEAAALRPEAAREYLRSMDALREYVENHPNSTNEWGGMSAELAGDKEWRRLAKEASRASERMYHGYATRP